MQKKEVGPTSQHIQKLTENKLKIKKKKRSFESTDFKTQMS